MQDKKNKNISFEKTASQELWRDEKGASSRRAVKPESTTATPPKAATQEVWEKTNQRVKHKQTSTTAMPEPSAVEAVWGEAVPSKQAKPKSPQEAMEIVWDKNEGY